MQAVSKPTIYGWSARWRSGGGEGYNRLEDTITWTTALPKDSVSLIRFLEELLVKRYPNKRVILVMDNAAYPESA